MVTLTRKLYTRDVSWDDRYFKSIAKKEEIQKVQAMFILYNVYDVTSIYMKQKMMQNQRKNANL